MLGEGELMLHASKRRQTNEDVSSLKYTSRSCRCNLIVGVIYLGLNLTQILNFTLLHTIPTAWISQFRIYEVKGRGHFGLQSFIMFLVSQDHNQTPKSSYKILAKLSQRCLRELDDQCKIHYLQVHRQNEMHQNQTADMSWDLHFPVWPVDSESDQQSPAFAVWLCLSPQTWQPCWIRPASLGPLFGQQ